MKTVKPSLIAPLHTVFPEKSLIFFWHPINHPHKQNIIISDAPFHKVLVYHVNHSEFLVLTHNIPEMTVSDKRNSTSNVMFVKCRVALTCPHWINTVTAICIYAKLPRCGQMRCKGKGEAKLCVGKPQKYALRILVESYHTSYHIISYHIISYHPVCFTLCSSAYQSCTIICCYSCCSIIIYYACAMNLATLHPTKDEHFREDTWLLKKWEESNWEMYQHSYMPQISTMHVKLHCCKEKGNPRNEKCDTSCKKRKR